LKIIRFCDTRFLSGISRIGMRNILVTGKLSLMRIKNVFLFFYNSEKPSPPTKITKGFTSIEYNGETKDNFVTLFSE
jgi:hypothetical protein